MKALSLVVIALRNNGMLPNSYKVTILIFVGFLLLAINLSTL